MNVFRAREDLQVEALGIHFQMHMPESLFLLELGIKPPNGFHDSWNCVHNRVAMSIHGVFQNTRLKKGVMFGFLHDV